jgi:chemotaxis protein CheC
MKDELGILKEVGSIAAAQASIALSEILERKIILNIPIIDVISYPDISKRVKMERVAVAVFSNIIVGLPGQIALILSEKDAFKLLNLSYKIKTEDKNAGVFTEIGLSLIKEIGNIVICSYTIALSLIIKRNILTSIPTLINGTTDIILHSIFSSSSEQDYAVLVEAAFEEPQENIKGGFCLALTHEAAADIKQACKKSLEELEK